MDENKEKKLNEDGVTETDTLSEKEKAEVGEILENLKNSKNEAVTTDWDGLVQVGATDEELVADDAVETEETEQTEDVTEEITEDDTLCVVCGKRKRYTEIDEDCLYCKACREKMKKTPMNFWGVLCFVLAIFTGFFAVVCGINAMNISISVIKGDKYFAEGKYYSAMSCYNEAVGVAERLNTEMGAPEMSTQEKVYDAGKRTYAKIIKTYYSMGSILTAQDYVPNFVSVIEKSGSLEKNRYSDIKEYDAVIDSFADTCSFINNRYQSVLTQISYSAGQMSISDIRSTLDELEKLKSNQNHNKYAVAYMQYYLCTGVKDAEKYQIKYLNEIQKGGKAYEGIYISQLCMLYLNEGKLAEVEKMCTDIINEATENIDYYQYLMKVKIKQNDPKGALELYNKAEKIVSEIYYSVDPETGLGQPLSTPYTLLAEKAVCHALLGEKEAALAAIDESYNLGLDIHTANVYALLHYVYHAEGTEPVEQDGMKIYDSVDNGYDAVLSIFSSNMLSLNEDVQAVIDGEKTLEDVFIRGEAYLQ